MLACKGPGKTACLAWLAWNFLLTRPNPTITATSISGDNLADGLWTEMAKWQQKSELLKQFFTWQKTRIFANENPETWWMSARAWSKSATPQEQADTLAGRHSDYILFILDESGGIPDAVMVSAEAALASCKEGHILQAGNPTHLEGPLYRAATRDRKLWWLIEITGDPDDPLRSPRVSAQWAREQIEAYGRESPWILVNIFGKFPPSSLNTLIGPDDVAEAQRRSYRDHDIVGSPKILGVDVARMGDDSSVLFPRQGMVAFNPTRYRNIAGFEGAGIVARKWGDWGADAVFIDDTGGYGAAWIEALTQLGRAPIGVPFSGGANDRRYFNKRAEMYFEAVEWIKRGGQLPPANAEGSVELAAALTRTTYSFRGDKMLLEPKDLVKVRLGYSPDHADAFCLTFAQPVMKIGNAPGRARHTFEHDPLPWNVPMMSGMGLSNMRSDFDPYRSA